jgi:hypothetical protein
MPSSAESAREAAFNIWRWSWHAARPRWISIAGDPIIDTAGRFEGFRGVGPTSPRSARRRSG